MPVAPWPSRVGLLVSVYAVAPRRQGICRHAAPPRRQGRPEFTANGRDRTNEDEAVQTLKLETHLRDIFHDTIKIIIALNNN